MEFPLSRGTTLFALCCVLIRGYYCGSTQEDLDMEGIEKFIATTYECHAHSNPGMIVSVVRNGTVLLARGHGVTDLERRHPVGNNTLFNVASLSKNMASALLLKLLHEKTNLTVDSKVCELLGNKFRFIDKFRTQEMTFADIMGHRTGVPPNNIIRFDTNLTREGVLERLSHLPTPDQFRVKYYYNNLMYGVVTHLVELLGGGGDSWETLMGKHFFQPLGMARSSFVTEIDYGRSDVAWPYVMHDGKLTQTPFEHSKRWGLLAGSVALVTTAEDMTKWMHFHLSGGWAINGSQIMDTKVLDQLYVPRMTLPTPTSSDYSKPDLPHTISRNTYTFGLRRGFYRGYTRFSHTGSNHGFRALLSLMPTEGVGVFIAMNGRDDHYQYREPLDMYLMDHAMGFEPWLNVSTVCAYPSPWRSPRMDVPTTPTVNAEIPLLRPVEQYQGTYHHPAYGYLHISFKSPSLQLAYGWASWDLYPRRVWDTNKKERFYAKGTNLTIAYNLDGFEFQADSENHIVALRASGFEVNAPPVFSKLGVPKKEATRSITAGNGSTDVISSKVFVFVCSFVMFMHK